mmetsp:Transcript_31045/g.41023  ORF Transcript_31045/g.41023 Transcript_31045/m.41023 type:complete len:469 (+) Transcript_31045:295-1701(+)|eukprot:CAMPEP_0117756616 /NCGR_PEP_ID=MMETSP0947-20121206/14189_1 /TAXON_ID=44440 /ORGANISM="Chattonella subsalsa, Strain CCMP2191" /LENGTH=468 /DNA_ID=CAMNT_0005576247 /DNA_START=294 /DNA_END=1700 /DNA_ORIENTATION=+
MNNQNLINLQSSSDDLKFTTQPAALISALDLFSRTDARCQVVGSNDAPPLLSQPISSTPKSIIPTQYLGYGSNNVQEQGVEATLLSPPLLVQKQAADPGAPPAMQTQPSYGIQGNGLLLAMQKPEPQTQTVQVIQPSFPMSMPTPLTKDNLVKTQPVIQYASVTNPPHVVGSSCFSIQSQPPQQNGSTANVSIFGREGIVQIPFEEANHQKTDKKRKDRNLREQKRSIKISKQIDQLRALLQDSGAQVKPNKYAVLSSVVSYIRQLQSQAVALDYERQKWLSETQEPNRKIIKRSSHEGLNYCQIFNNAGLAAAIASLDGRIVDSNNKFQSLTGYAKEEVLKLTLFNLAAPHDLQRMFSVVGQMLNNTFGSSEYICEYILLKKERKTAKMSLSLIRGTEGEPKFFHCIMIEPKTNITIPQRLEVAVNNPTQYLSNSCSGDDSSINTSNVKILSTFNGVTFNPNSSNFK